MELNSPEFRDATLFVRILTNSATKIRYGSLAGQRLDKPLECVILCPESECAKRSNDDVHTAFIHRQGH